MTEPTSAETLMYSRQQIYALREKMKDVPYLLPDGMEILMTHEEKTEEEKQKEMRDWKSKWWLTKHEKLKWRTNPLEEKAPGETWTQCAPVKSQHMSPQERNGQRKREKNRPIMLPTLTEHFHGTDCLEVANIIRKRVNWNSYETLWLQYYTENREVLMEVGTYMRTEIRSLHNTLPLHEDEVKFKQWKPNFEREQQPAMRPLSEGHGNNVPSFNNSHAFSGSRCETKEDALRKEIMSFFNGPCLANAGRLRAISQEDVPRVPDSRRYSEMSLFSDATFHTARESLVPELEEEDAGKLRKIRHSSSGVSSMGSVDDYEENTANSVLPTPMLTLPPGFTADEAITNMKLNGTFKMSLQPFDPVPLTVETQQVFEERCEEPEASLLQAYSNGFSNSLVTDPGSPLSYEDFPPLGADPPPGLKRPQKELNKKQQTPESQINGGNESDNLEESIDISPVVKEAKEGTGKLQEALFELYETMAALSVNQSPVSSTHSSGWWSDAEQETRAQQHMSTGNQAGLQQHPRTTQSQNTRRSTVFNESLSSRCDYSPVSSTSSSGFSSDDEQSTVVQVHTNSGEHTYVVEQTNSENKQAPQIPTYISSPSCSESPASVVYSSEFCSSVEYGPKLQEHSDSTEQMGFEEHVNTAEKQACPPQSESPSSSSSPNSKEIPLAHLFSDAAKKLKEQKKLKEHKACSSRCATAPCAETKPAPIPKPPPVQPAEFVPAKALVLVPVPNRKKATIAGKAPIQQRAPIPRHFTSKPIVIAGVERMVNTFECEFTGGENRTRMEVSNLDEISQMQWDGTWKLGTTDAMRWAKYGISPSRLSQKELTQRLFSKLI